MKQNTAELHEGLGAWDRFRKALKTVVDVPKTALPPRPTRKKKKAAEPKG